MELSSLFDLVSEIDSLDPDATIYAAKPWTCDSPAIVALEPPGGKPPAIAIDQSLSYFLEVFLANEVLDDWLRMQTIRRSTAEKCDRLIAYAVNDA